MIVTLSGQPGSGKTSVSKELAARYGLAIISAGEQFRRLASERNMTLAEFGALAESDSSIDIAIDQRQKELAANHKNCIVEGRLAGRNINADLKIYLKTSPEVRAVRIARREDVSYEQALRETIAREKSEMARYKAYYGLDLADLSVYPLIIDTTKWDVAGVTEIIFKAIEELKLNVAR